MENKGNEQWRRIRRSVRYWWDEVTVWEGLMNRAGEQDSHNRRIRGRERERGEVLRAVHSEQSPRLMTVINYRSLKRDWSNVPFFLLLRIIVLGKKHMIDFFLFSSML